MQNRTALPIDRFERNSRPPKGGAMRPRESASHREVSTDPVVPGAAAGFGFAVSPIGTHSSKTMMLREMSLLIGASDDGATYADLHLLAVEENVILKSTLSNRKEVLKRLRELYGLRREITLYRALRDLWPYAGAEQPLLAFLCAAARDPLLRATAPLMLEQPEGAAVPPQMLEAEVEA